MNRKTVIITGANAGIGFATALTLSKKDFQILLHARNEVKAKHAAEQILKEHPTAQVEPVWADLGQLEEIAVMVQKIESQYNELDVLINNAGVWNSKLELSTEGVELTLAINHLAYAYLAHLLYPLMTKAPEARLICVASDSHRQIKGMYWDDLNLSKNYHGLRSYAQSKLANVLFVYEFARRCPESKISSYAVQPGLVQTDIGLKGNTWLHRLAWKVRRNMKGHKTPAEGAATSIYLANAPEAAGQTGKYWDNCAPKTSFSSSNDPAEASRLWEWT
ncbi:MAG: SDR family NAD(P)-dependent oxidoreductase, partial [Bacteroidota bacterium]